MRRCNADVIAYTQAINPLPWNCSTLRPLYSSTIVLSVALCVAVNIVVIHNKHDHSGERALTLLKATEGIRHEECGIVYSASPKDCMPCTHLKHNAP
jgi:hypothetical protein